jgi:hypothetical protein
VTRSSTSARCSNYWPDLSDTDDDRPIYNAGMESLGLPTRAEVVERYAAATGLDVGDVDWYEAFACWKTAVVLQQLYTPYVHGESTDADGDSGREGRRAGAPSDGDPRPHGVTAPPPLTRRARRPSAPGPPA